MSFDPNLPVNNTTVDADFLRGQFASLKSLIDNVPAGQQGPPGLKGEPGEQGPVGPAGADSTVPGPAGADGRSVVEVYDSGDGRAMIRMSDGTIYGPFTVASGPAGQQGSNGADSTVPGPAGPAGPDGRSIVNVRDNGDGRAVVEMSDGGSYGPFSVASGPQGIQGDRGNDGGQGPAGNDGVSVVEVFDSGDGRAIVRLSNGSTYGPFTVAGGPPGPQGGPGEKGDKGDPGEITSQQLTDAIAGTSNNTNGVELLDTSGITDPVQLAQANKINELINALRR